MLEELWDELCHCHDGFENPYQTRKMSEELWNEIYDDGFEKHYKNREMPEELWEEELWEECHDEFENQYQTREMPYLNEITDFHVHGKSDFSIDKQGSFNGTALMASSSTSSIPKTNFTCDVFLSFRGEDTRTSFIDHLYHALKQENIETYKDDENLERGKKISKELIQAIQDSRFHVIVFSKNYASSSWCLDELVNIIECQKTETGHTVYPIFYDVEPTQVRKQSGEFGKAFSKHENDETTEIWRKALVEATSFSGKDLTIDRYEVEFINTVVKEISSKLPSISADENLIGMRTRINGVVSSLNAFPDDFCMIGITGMGGIGKTTLSRAVFDQISFKFEGKSFVANVREVSKPDFSGLNKLQQQVLRDVSNDQGITVNNFFDGKSMMKKKMPGRKVLIVLDDVDHIEQLKALAGEPSWFMPGSKIIITTRDKQVLLAHKVNSILDVKMLTDEEALCLFSRYAFGTESPSLGYEKLSHQVVRYAAGLPLTITILGSTLYGETEHVWKDTLKELEKIPLDGTLQRLELSYKGLDINCQEIFLDVACLWKGRDKDEAIKALESCGFHAIRGLSVLEKKSLITTRDGCLDMHDHIQEMGRYIVRRLHPDEPNKHSRLWVEEEIKDMFANNQGTEAIKCIHLQSSSGITDLGATMKSLGKMEKLRLLSVNTCYFFSDWKPDEVSQYFPNSLRYLKWFPYPSCSLPKTFQASDLVCLDMSYGRMEQLWEGGERKVLHKLRFLRLCCSKLRSFDLGLAPNLEILDLENCCDLVELHMLVPKIETLNLEGCVELVELDMPCECPQLKSLKLSSSKLRSFNLGVTQNIETLHLYILGSVKLDMPRECPQLKSLKLSSPYLTYFNLAPTPMIEVLKLEECDYLVELDMFLECPQLESLDLSIRNLRTLNLGPTPNLKTLNLEECYNLVELRMPGEHCKLKTICLQCPQLRTSNLGPTHNIEALALDVSADLVELSIPVGCLQLEYLKLVKSKLKTLELTRNLKTLILEDCDFVELHIPDGDVKLKSLAIKRCSKLKNLDLGRTPNLESLCLEECSSLVKLHAPIGGVKLLINLKGHFTTNPVDIRRLHHHSSPPKFELECSYTEDLPSSIGNIESLISEGLFCPCTDAESFVRRICGLQCLTKLTLEGNISKPPKDLHMLQCLEKLTLKSTKIKFLGIDIYMLKRLKSLELYRCELLEQLPRYQYPLESLKTLKLEWCTALRDIPNNIRWMESLRSLSLYGCQRVEEFPKDLEFPQLLELDIRGTCINNLPRRILWLEEHKGLRIYRPENKTPATSVGGGLYCAVRKFFEEASKKAVHKMSAYRIENGRTKEE